MMEQIVIILIVVVVLVVLDGLRRRWLMNRDQVVLKLDRKSIPPADIDDDELFRSELPNGGARTLPRRGDPVRTGKPSPKLKSLQQQREQVKPEHVPVLLETVELEEERIEHTNVYADASVAEPFRPGGKAPQAPIDEVVESLTGAEEAGMGKYEESIDDYLEEAFDADLEETRICLGREDSDDEWEDEEDEEEVEVGDDWEEAWEEEQDEEEFEEGFEEEFEEDEFGDEGLDDDFEDDDEDEDEEDDDYEDDDYEDDDYDEDEDDEDEDDDYEDEDDEFEEEEPAFPDPYDDFEEDPYARREPTLGSMVSARERQQELFQEELRRVNAQPAAAPAKARGKVRAAEAAVDTSSASTVAPEPQGPGDFQEVLIINVMARPGNVFSGSDLLPLLQARGMQLGEMSIFHKHSGRNASGELMFSMANMVKPGTFDLAGMDTFTTPGVSLFMQLPNQAGNMKAFDAMLDMAHALQREMGGELKDENRSVFTRQTIEHCRQRIRDFELRQLARK